MPKEVSCIAVMRSLLYFLLFTCVGISYAKDVNEFIRDGGFELGIVDADIVRLPRYLKNGVGDSLHPVRDDKHPISGNYSLKLPAIKSGEFRLIYRVVPLVARERYEISLDLRSTGNVAVRLEAFTGWARLGEKRGNLNPGDNHIVLEFRMADKPLISSNEVPVFFRIWVNNEESVWIDNVSLKGVAGVSGEPKPVRAVLEPDRRMAVYPLNGTGAFEFRGYACDDCQLFYRIYDPIAGIEMVSGELGAQQKNAVLAASIPLDLSKRGFYWVEAQVRDPNENQSSVIRHSYVVINPEVARGQNYRRFGVAMEEYGATTQIDAFVDTEDYYRLAREIGVGSARVFSLLMPDMISSNGRDFDFSEADQALGLLEKYDIEPMVVLGNNVIARTAGWLRSSSENENIIDLEAGLNTPEERKRFERSLKLGKYFDLEKYAAYLEAVFTHYKGKVKYYELWNEPGHKFLARDFVRIANITREVQQRIDPESHLVGYSSTRRGQLGAGRKPDVLPKFLDEVQEYGGLKYIDILSYHSEHAYPFMSKEPDYDDFETNYVPRLRSILKKANIQNLAIWDTERGIPWVSPHDERLDYKAGVKLWKHARPSINVLDVARQLPMVYAAAFSNDVERLFWFYLESSSGAIHRSNRRWGFFDAQREPMPQIPVYGSMTRFLSGAEFVRRIDSDSGGRAYIFRRDNEYVSLLYNWKQQESLVRFEGVLVSDMKVFDIMGNTVNLGDQVLGGVELQVDGWPIYVEVPEMQGIQIEMLN